MMLHHTARILDGQETSKALLEKVRLDVEGLIGPKPKLVAVLVGENPASEIYVARKMKVAEKIGVASDLHRFPADIGEAELIDHIHRLNDDIMVNAILVQLPLPRHIDSLKVLDTVSVHKDVDGFHPVNLGRLLMGIEPPAMPCTPAGIIQLLDAYKINVDGMRAAVVGRSNIVGKPIALMLTHRNATVTICHSRTSNLDDILRDADLIVAAAGQQGLVKAEAIKPEAVVIDVGINRLEDGKIVGDVDFESARHRAGFITPVPKGVGPMTIAMLMVNTVRLYKAQHGQPIENLLFI